MKGKFIYFAMYAMLGIFAGFFSFVFIAAVGLIFTYYLSRIKNLSTIQIGICLSLFLIFFLNAVHSSLTNNSRLKGDEQDFIIHYHNGAKVDGNSFSTAVTDLQTEEKLILHYRIKSKAEKGKIEGLFNPNLVCRVKGTLERPVSSQNNPNSFDYEKYLNRDRIFWILHTDNLELAKCKTRNPSVMSLLTQLRKNGVSHLDKLFPPGAASISAALIFGERDLLDYEVEKDYMKIGVIHLLSISGLHIGLITGILYFLFLRIGLTREKSMILLVILLPLYAVLTGGAPPVIRAVMMILFILIERMIFRSRGMPIDSLSLAFMLYTFISPQAIFNTGFQLSFIVSFALVVSANSLLNVRTPSLQILTVSFIAQISSLPIILYYFYEISIISIIANMVFVPFFSVIILPLCFIAFLLSLISYEISRPIIALLSGSVEFSDHIARILSSLPYSSLIIGKPSVFVLTLLMTAIFSLFVGLERRVIKPHYEKIFYFLPLLVVVLHLIMTHYSSYGKIVFIDVDQGDSILVKLPFNKGTYLIDTGGALIFEQDTWEQKRKSFDTGSDVVVPFLKSEGVNKIDKLILTHGDQDHIGGALSVLNQLEVQQLVLPVAIEHSEKEKELLSFAKTMKIPVKFAKAGDSWRVGKSTFYIMSPPVGVSLKGNDSSIVIKADIGGLDWLFTGDLEQEGEKSFINRYRKLDVDVLKVGHHGSKTSTSVEFLNHVQPEIAIISVGENNRFGHPNQEVIERLGKNKILIYRTDQQGAVTYIFKGNKGTFSTVLP